MSFSALELQAKKNGDTVLIVDKIGILGQALASEFCKDYLVVFVSQVSSLNNKNLIHVPFKRKIPKVPVSNYSKIFIIDDKESITRKSISSFVSKAREMDIPLFFINGVRNANNKFIEDLAGSYSKTKVLIYGDLFDNKLFLEKDLSITKYILEAREDSRIDVLGNGLSLNIPITFEDTIKLIIKAAYVNIPQRIILLFSPHPITDISLANLFHKINPDIKVDFVKGKKEKQIDIPKDSQYALGRYDLETKIKNLNLEKNESRKIIPNNKKRRRINLLKPLIFILLIFLFLALLPLGTTFFYSTLASAQINDVKTFAQKDDFDNAIKKAKNSVTFYDTALKISNVVLMEAKLIGREEDADELINKIQGARSVSLAAINLLDGLSSIKKVYSSKSINPKIEFSNAINSFKSSIVLIQKAKAEGNMPKKLEEEIDSISPFIDLFSNSSEILLEVLGFDASKKYLVLFQDNSELRPGGGVIESYAILKIKDAKITEFNSYGVSVIDNKKNQIDPPFALRRYLPLSNLTLKDSSFDPDFINSAISASNIYSIATNEKVDGVISVDLDSMKNLLAGVGSLLIVPESEEFKKNGLEIIKNELEKSENISYFSLLRQVGISIKEKHLLFVFQNPGQQKIFTVNGWSGALWDNRSSERGKINDFLGISEANLGGNKANYFVSRSISKKLVVLDDGKVSSRLKIVFNNSSKKENKLGGNYKNYLQLILPSGSRIVEILIDDKKVEIKKAVSDFRVYESINFKPPSGFEVDERREMGKSIFGFLLGIGPSEIKSITINYVLPYSVSVLDKSINYSLKVYKQPGIESYPLNLTFSLPQRYQILEGNETNHGNIISDEDFSFTFSQR